MDTRKFDDITRALSDRASRRTVLKGVAGGGVAALLAAVGLRGAQAQDVTAEGKRRKLRCSLPIAGTPMNPTG